jgi:nucleotide-binding universal stress UspA family protein
MTWLPKKCVVVPVDFSGMSAQAIGTALEFVESPAHVHAIHVVLPLDNMSAGPDWGIIDDESRATTAQEHFDGFLEEQGFSNVTSVIRTGDPGIQITEYANEVSADLIVIPSHGYHGLKRLLLGSVSERVIRHADIPTLVLRRSDAD